MSTTVVLPPPWSSQYRRRPSAAVANPASSGSRARVPVSAMLISRPRLEHYVERRLGDALEAREAGGVDDIADRASPAWAPSASPTSCESEAGVHSSVENP